MVVFRKWVMSINGVKACYSIIKIHQNKIRKTITSKIITYNILN